jgi:hypothetical protein
MGYMHPPHIAPVHSHYWTMSHAMHGSPVIVDPSPVLALNLMGDDLAAVEFEWPATPAPIQRVGYLHRHLNAIRAKQRAARVTLELQRGWFNA